MALPSLFSSARRTSPAPAPTAPALGPGAAEALRGARRAARRLPAYRDLLLEHGADPSDLRFLEDVPYLDKQAVFGDGIGRWIQGGRLTDAAELVTSSGTTGGAFSVGVSSRAERDELERVVDRALTQMGARPGSPSLLLNCLPMGVSIPSRLATVASPSVHLEMALEMLVTYGPAFDRTVIVGEPVFLKELAERGRHVAGRDWTPERTFMVAGGEWIAESWRTHVESLAGFGGPGKDPQCGILISMGAAELGLHCLVETPELRMARRLLTDRGARADLFGHDPGYSPTLFSFDPDRLFLEERAHERGETTLVATTLTPRLVPLIRYDLGDLADIVAPETMNAHLAEHGSPVRVTEPVVAVWGRRSPAGGLRPELVKERIFAIPADAACLSGRFQVQSSGSQPGALCLHVQLRDGAAARPGLSHDLEHFLAAATGVPGEAIVHGHREYPFHLAGDYQHKPHYAPTPGGIS